MASCPPAYSDGSLTWGFEFEQSVKGANAINGALWYTQGQGNFSQYLRRQVTKFLLCFLQDGNKLIFSAAKTGQDVVYLLFDFGRCYGNNLQLPWDWLVVSPSTRDDRHGDFHPYSNSYSRVLSITWKVLLLGRLKQENRVR